MDNMQENQVQNEPQKMNTEPKIQQPSAAKPPVGTGPVGKMPQAQQQPQQKVPQAPKQPGAKTSNSEKAASLFGFDNDEEDKTHPIDYNKLSFSNSEVSQGLYRELKDVANKGAKDKTAEDYKKFIDTNLSNKTITNDDYNKLNKYIDYAFSDKSISPEDEKFDLTQLKTSDLDSESAKKMLSGINKMDIVSLAKLSESLDAGKLGGRNMTSRDAYLMKGYVNDYLNKKSQTMRTNYNNIKKFLDKIENVEGKEKISPAVINAAKEDLYKNKKYGIETNWKDYINNMLSGIGQGISDDKSKQDFLDMVNRSKNLPQKFKEYVGQEISSSKFGEKTDSTAYINKLFGQFSKENPGDSMYTEDELKTIRKKALLKLLFGDLYNGR